MLINKHRIVGDVAYISLTKGQETVIDVADIEKTLELRWYARPHDMGSYYAQSRHEGKTVYLHRNLLDAPKGMYVDHINHDTLDNRRSNLRLVTNQQNSANRNGAYATSKTGIRGISIHRHAPNVSGRNAGRRANPEGVMYVFRCHCVTCKAAKYFPHTTEGLAQAKAFAEAHYAAMKTPEEK